MLGIKCSDRFFSDDRHGAARRDVFPQSLRVTSSLKGDTAQLFLNKVVDPIVITINIWTDREEIRMNSKSYLSFLSIPTVPVLEEGHHLFTLHT